MNPKVGIIGVSQTKYEADKSYQTIIEMVYEVVREALEDARIERKDVDNVVTAAVAARWRYNGSGNLQTYEFEAGHELPHEIIDPDHDVAQIDLVYPILVGLIEEQ